MLELSCLIDKAKQLTRNQQWKVQTKKLQTQFDQRVKPLIKKTKWADFKSTNSLSNFYEV
jgi:hypothetical protein